MASTHLGLYDTVSLLCSSFALNSVRKPMESTLEWYFCLSPVHLISSSFTFLATASSHWMKVTRTIFVPGMDVTLIVLQKHPNTLHNHQDQCTVADNKNVLYRKL